MRKEDSVPCLGEMMEVVNELVLESDQADKEGHNPLKWHRQVAVSTLLMALITAVGALLAGMTAHEALMDRTQEIIDISIAENDRVSIEVLKAKVEIMTNLGKAPDPADLTLIQTYEAERRTLEADAAQEEARVQVIAAPHLILAVAVTLLSVGIGLSGMSIIVGQKFLWFAGLVFALVGTMGVGYGILTLFF
jgi:hypothetical protein